VKVSGRVAKLRVRVTETKKERDSKKKWEKEALKNTFHV